MDSLRVIDLYSIAMMEISQRTSTECLKP